MKSTQEKGFASTLILRVLDFSREPVTGLRQKTRLPIWCPATHCRERLFRLSACKNKKKTRLTITHDDNTECSFSLKQDFKARDVLRVFISFRSQKQRARTHQYVFGMVLEP